ncbi:radical SAM protein [Chitinispirillales bacterium ANBcel5]|uniref:7-carboxy-7-deazaguanine synthase QueE n=1 Tax=Cellulosispirillum alkaliphilum TaxID=3039283 RepID=UPI002A53E21D|nr:radical SAM protein [Chitinispirillales bacterium ANBcel5]
MIEISEIFKSIQGESTFAGKLCSFVRLKGCNLSCTWCDTSYTQTEMGQRKSVDSIIKELGKHQVSLVEITGGEPLLQNQTPELCEKLLNQGYTVLLETNGSRDIGVLPSGVRRIVDIKCPGSGMASRFLKSNIDLLVDSDECKFVISDLNDARWAFEFIRKYDLISRCPVNISPVGAKGNLRELAEFIIERNEDVRLNIQLHKIIWGDRRGV